jgi:hypothetical protein
MKSVAMVCKVILFRSAVTQPLILVCPVHLVCAHQMSHLHNYQVNHRVTVVLIVVISKNVTRRICFFLTGVANEYG